MKYFLDTSAVLNGGLYNYEYNYISPLTLIELEKIKSSHDKTDEIRFLARQAIRDIIAAKNIEVVIYPQVKINRTIKKYKFLMDINDHKILSAAELLGQKQNVTFVTSDGAQYLFAKQMPHIEALFFEKQPAPTDRDDQFYGWGRYYPNNTELNNLYSSPKINTLKCRVNEFAEIFVNGELRDILFWDGKEYTPLKYKNIKNPYTGEVVKPRNLQQKMAFALLQNPDIKVKLLTSAWGGGKTKLALDYALEQVMRGQFEKLIFVRNNIIVAGTNDIGFLPGDVRDKLSIFALCIADHVGGEAALNDLMDRGLIQVIPLSHIRGRSIRNAIVLCDECENMDDKLVTLLISRIEESSELIFCGDVAQIDAKRFELHNGIQSMLTNLSGNPLFGTVKLIKSQRGPVAQLCDLMRPPM